MNSSCSPKAYLWCVGTCHPLTHNALVWRCRYDSQKAPTLSYTPNHLQIPGAFKVTSNHAHTQGHTQCADAWSGFSGRTRCRSGSRWISVCTCLESRLSTVKLLVTCRWRCLQIPSRYWGKVPSSTIPACAPTSLEQKGRRSLFF